MVNWLIACIRTGDEELAARKLASEGVETYFPLFPHWGRPNHDRKARSARVRQVEPAYPGYLFIAEAPGFWIRMHTAPRLRYLHIGEHIVRLQDREIEAMRAQAAVWAKAAEENRKQRPFKIGETVDVTDGWLKGSPGIVRRKSSGGRTLVEVNGVEVNIPSCFLRLTRVHKTEGESATPASGESPPASHEPSRAA